MPAGEDSSFDSDSIRPPVEWERMVMDVVENFNSDSSTTQVLLVSTQCGGEGLNLQGANFVILVDPWWNPALESQSIHRAYRRL
jgi:SNF2 family DNA or RNA helicase